jgi:glycosyltransferase involved in cell wall biosynthesis
LLNPTAPTARVDVLLNGHHAGRARLGLDWPAVEAAYPVPHASLSGFEHLVDLSALPTAESLVRLQVVARVIGGRPQVVLERTGARVRPRPHASSEDGWLQHRITSLRSSISRPPADRLNLVAFTHQLDLGGGQLWLSELLLRSGAGRHFPCMVIAGSDGPLRTELEEQGITVHVTARSPVDDIQVYQARIIELSILVAAEGCNAALINTITSWVGADVTTRMGIPTVWAIHESLTPAAYWAQVSPNGQAVPSIGASFDTALRATSALVFEAESTRRLYESAAGSDRTLVIPYGIDTHAVESYRARVSRASARARAGIPDGRKMLLVMGTTEPRKAQTRLVEAFALVEQDYPDWLLVFVGDTGTPYAAELKRYISRVGLDDRVRIYPVVADTYAWYRSADLLVSASDMESLPRSVLEAMCFGVPILATSIFGVSELITDGDTGFLFEPSDLAATTGALHRVFSLHEEVLAATGQAGRALVLESYDYSGYCTDITALLHGLVHDDAAMPADILADRQPRARTVARTGSDELT